MLSQGGGGERESEARECCEENAGQEGDYGALFLAESDFAM